MTERSESEFGKGLTYCIGMFLAHAEKAWHLKEIYEKSKLGGDWAHMWFNGASDHLYDIQIPRYFPKAVSSRIEVFQSKCLGWGHGYEPADKATEENVLWAIGEGKELLRLIDEQFGIETTPAEWS